MWSKLSFKLFILGLFIGIVNLTACASKPVKSSQEIVKIKKFISNCCPLNKEYGKQDTILATLYFKSNQTALASEQKHILQQIVNIFNSCNNKILILGHASNLEARFNHAARVSYLRAYNVYKYLQTDIPDDYLYFAFCSNVRNKYIEDKSIAQYGNQRVEIIQLVKGLSSNAYICTENIK